MMFTIQKFILFFIFSLLFIFYTIFGYYFFKQEKEMANIILKTIKYNISELSYTISKGIKNKEDISSFRSLIDRVASNQEFIETIMILDGDNLLLSSNPKYTTLSETLNNKKTISTYIDTLNMDYIEEEIRFYEGKNSEKFRLIYILKHDEIKEHFIKNKIDFIVHFGLLPIIAFVFLFILLRIYVSKPLELLRQFAYDNHKIPKAFKLKELEAIRLSMFDSFSRLESEKKELYQMARTDSLSGLANRNSLNEYLEKLIPSAKRDKKEFAFLFLDIDHFKTVNDSLGHNVGDELLQNIASIIKKALRSNDFVARIGGDEFVIIIQDYNSYLELTNIITRIQEYLCKPWIIQTHPVQIACSIGISFYPKDATTSVNLMKNADIAMYEAKKLGRNQFQFFTQTLNETVQNTILLDQEMKLALKNSEYSLFYQPKIDIKTSKIIGAEALIRWIHPKKGIISPNSFIPLAEENGFIKKLGDWIIDEVLEQHLKWKEKGIDIPISINISVKQLFDMNFETKLISKLKLKNIKPSKIDLEITEYLFMEQSNETINKLEKIHDFGVSISLDDFGTGYSSLSYLKKFPIDYLKIDKAFLDDFNTPDGSIFLETIVKMGQTLKIKVIAEGVETQEQVNYLKDISCDQIQGYFFSKPLSSKDFEKFYEDF